MTTKNNDGKDLGEVKLTTIQYEDGHEAPITWNDFKELLRKSYNLEQGSEAAESMTADELDILKQVLWFLLEFDITAVEGWAEGAPDDPKRKARTREILRNALQRIIDYLDSNTPAEEIPQADNITKFLRGEIEYMLAPRPRGYNELLKVSSVGERGLQYREVEGEVKISFPNRLSREEHIIRQACELAFLDKNFHGARKNLLTRVTIPIDEIMDVLGRPNNPENKKKFKRRLERDILPNIKDAHIDARAKKAKKEGANDIWIQTNIGQACGIVNDHIYFQFSEDYARYINTGIVKPYHEKLMRLGSRQFPLPYYVGQKMHDQYFHYGNQRRGANDTLRVRTLLNHCKEALDYEYILEADPTHWKKLIKGKYERALNEIQKAGLFKWEYCRAGLKEIPQAEINRMDFYEWSELYVTFQLIPEEPPEQAQRVENWEKRIEKAKEKKEAEDAKAVVEADKIRKRKRRKKTAKDEKGKVVAPKEV